MESHLVLLHHCLPLVQAAGLVVLLGLLALVLEDNPGVHVVLVNGNAMRLVLLPEVVPEVVVVRFGAGRVLAILSHFRAFQFLIVYLDFLLVP